jgi:ribosomal protein S15P/S13E
MRELQAADTKLATQDIGRTEGMAQALLARSIKNIQHHFNFNRKDVDEWIEKGKIRSHHKDAFLTYAEK